jgi:hypothetical protein
MLDVGRLSVPGGPIPRADLVRERLGGMALIMMLTSEKPSGCAHEDESLLEMIIVPRENSPETVYFELVP